MTAFFNLFDTAKSAKNLEQHLEAIRIKDVMRDLKAGLPPQQNPLSAAISQMVLHTAHRVCTGIREVMHLADTSTSYTASDQLYDAIAFQAAAYCQYWLMKEHRDENDPRYPTYMESLTRCDLVLRAFTRFDLLTKDFIPKQVLSYTTLEDNQESAQNKFEELLLDSILNKFHVFVSLTAPDPINPSLETAIQSYVSIFHENILADLKNTVDSLFSKFH